MDQYKDQHWRNEWFFPNMKKIALFCLLALGCGCSAEQSNMPINADEELKRQTAIAALEKACQLDGLDQKLGSRYRVDWAIRNARFKSSVDNPDHKDVIAESSEHLFLYLPFPQKRIQVICLNREPPLFGFKLFISDGFFEYNDKRAVDFEGFEQ